MSHKIFSIKNDESFNDKLKEENSKNNYKNFLHFSSLIKNQNEHNKYNINTSSNIYNNTKEMPYINTESNISNNNYCSCLNDCNTLFSNKDYYFLKTKKSKNRPISVGYKIFHMNKNLKNRLYSAKVDNNNKNKKENEIYLNNYINTSSDEKIIKRIQTTKGFLRKIDFELNQLLSNKDKKKNLTIQKSHNFEKNLDFNFHNNNYTFELIPNDMRNKNEIKTKLFFNTKNNHKNKNNIINSFNHKNKISEKDNNFKTIINNITRKVEFLNEKNNTLSNENTMNLLNNEEYFLYKKLNDFFNEIYSIKKFSKSIFDENNGNKYLLPLFNNKILSNYEKKENNKNNIHIYNKFNKYDLLDEINDINFNNNSKDFNKKIIKVYSKNKLVDKTKKKLNILFFPYADKYLSTLENYKNNNLTYDNKNRIKIEKKRKNDKTFSYKTETNIFVKNKTKNNIKNRFNGKENSFDNYILESTKMKNFKVLTPNKKSKYENKTKIKKFKTFDINEITIIKNIFNNKINNKINDVINNKNIEKKIKLINNEKYSKKENDRSRLNINKTKINKNNKGLKKDNKITLKINKEKIDDNNKDKNENNIENSPDKIEAKREEKLKIANQKRNRNNEIKRILRLNTKSNIKKFDNFENKKENNKLNGNLIMKKLSLVNNDKENLNDLSSSFDIEREEERLKQIKRINMSNNVILKKNIEMEEKKIITKINNKKTKTIKLLYQYIKRNIKETIQKEYIKQLLTYQEFRQAVDLLKKQIDKSNEYSNEDSSKIIKPITDDEVVDILYREVSKDEENLKKAENNPKMRKSTYIPGSFLKSKNEEKKIEIIEEKESEEVIKMRKEREKEKEKLKIMVNEMTLSNELRFHIQETNNKEIRERFQSILSQIESYQNLSMADYVEAIRNNYLLLKEEMNKIISDKEMEDRINGFVTNLDIERNIIESKWNYLSDRLNIIDNKFHSQLGKYNKNIKKGKK